MKYYLQMTLYHINKIALKFVRFCSYINSWNHRVLRPTSPIQFSWRRIIVVCSTIYTLLYNGRTYYFYLLNLITSCVIAVTDLLQQCMQCPTPVRSIHTVLSCCSRKPTGGNPIGSWT